MSRTAKALETLLGQVNAAYPNRSKSWDGTLGDSAHAARKSDHNPNAAGVVQAMDITHDPAHGLDSYKLADRLLASHDPRIKYIISNHRIGSSYKTGGVMPWNWRPYNGVSPHDHHVHVSVVDDPAGYDSTAPWSLDSELVPVPLPVAPIDSDLHQRMMQKILSYEYDLRPFKVETVTDGTREIAGINEGKLPDVFARIAPLAGDDAAVEREATKFYLQYTNIAMQWHANPGVEFYLRDCILNRGPTGAAIILQKAVEVEEDGAVGPNTRAAVAKFTPADLLTRLDAARQAYELEKYGKRERLWRGMQNRWAKALADARSFAGQEPLPVTPISPPTPLPPPVVDPTPAPPVLPAVDWNLIARLYSIDWEEVVRVQGDAIKLIEQAQQELSSKMQPVVQQRKPGQSGDPNSKEESIMTTPTAVRAEVAPWYTSKTVWLAAIAAAVPLINALTKGSINITPETQDWIATIITTLAGSGAVFSKVTSTNIQPTGANSIVKGNG